MSTYCVGKAHSKPYVRGVLNRRDMQAAYLYDDAKAPFSDPDVIRVRNGNLQIADRSLFQDGDLGSNQHYGKTRL